MTPTVSSTSTVLPFSSSSDSPGAAPAHDEAAVDLVEVEDVRRPAELEHHVVRDVDQRRHRALAAAREAIDHPARRRARAVSTPRTTRPEKRPHRSGASTVDRQHRRRSSTGTGGNVGVFERRAGQRRDLARDAEDAQAVAEVGRELEREDRVVERRAAARTSRPTDACVVEDQQAAMVVGELQLARRAQHAAALDAAQLADLDRGTARRPSLGRRQLGADAARTAP